VGQVDYFLKLDGIDGESSDDKHRGEIAVDAWSWGVSRPAPRSIQDIHFTMRTSKASPKLMIACASGQHIKSGLLTCRRADKDRMEFLAVALIGVLVSSFELGTAAPDTEPLDRIALNFTKIQITYTEQKPDGSPGPSTAAGWDVVQSKPA
jgi:type VI secretion system secreted protein Hcp